MGSNASNKFNRSNWRINNRYLQQHWNSMKNEIALCSQRFLKSSLTVSWYKHLSTSHQSVKQRWNLDAKTNTQTQLLTNWSKFWLYQLENPMTSRTVFFSKMFQKKKNAKLQQKSTNQENYKHPSCHLAQFLWNLNTWNSQQRNNCCFRNSRSKMSYWTKNNWQWFCSIILHKQGKMINSSYIERNVF